MATTVRRRLGLSVFLDPSRVSEKAGPRVAVKKAATNEKSKGRAKKAEPASRLVKNAASATSRKRVSRKASTAKPRRRKASEAGSDDQKS
jgi:hypothetical protein